MTPASSARFHCANDIAASPCDLIELAAQLRTGSINAETLVRREGTEDWHPLGQLPEFSLIQTIPIEEIALHLEKKERVPDPAPAYSFPWGIIIPALLLAGAGITHVLWPSPEKTSTASLAAPLSSPRAEPWVTTETSYFTINAPVLLKPEKAEPRLESYSGETLAKSGGISFYAIGTDFRGIVAPDDDAILNVFENSLARAAPFEIVRRSNLPGQIGRELLLRGNVNGKAIVAKARLLIVNRRAYAYFIIGPAAEVDQDYMDRYLNSFAAR